jgi:hypothetical protein
MESLENIQKKKKTFIEILEKDEQSQWTSSTIGKMNLKYTWLCCTVQPMLKRQLKLNGFSKILVPFQ